jgi:hypothetical protein
MKFVSQGYDTKLCGQACLAMITGKSLGAICDELNNFSGTSLENDLMPYLEPTMKNVELSRVTRYGLKITLEHIPNNSIILLSSPNWNGKNGHFIIKQNDLYYNPEVGILTEIDMSYRKVESYLTFMKL